MKLNVLVLFGGESVEHEISVLTAHQVIEALDKEKYEIIPIYITKKSELYTGSELFDLANFADLDQLIAKLTPIVFYQENGQAYFKPLKEKLFKKQEPTRIDVALPAVHGTNGEDGTLQGLLSMYHIPYAGCDVIASAIGQDKVHMKQILESEGLPITRWTWFYAHEYESQKATIEAFIMKQVGLPCVIKPSNLGSSIAIHIANNQKELQEYIEEACQYDFKIIVEKKVDNLREINASVLGDIDGCAVSVLEEVGMNTGGKLLDYKAKYQPDGSKTGTKGSKVGAKVASPKLAGGSKGMASTDRQVPAKLSPQDNETVTDLAKKVYRILGSSGVCRIDFMLDNLNKKIYVNEINTIPGSYSYYLWEASDVTFANELDKLIHLALTKQQAKQKKIFSYDTNILKGYAKK